MDGNNFNPYGQAPAGAGAGQYGQPQTGYQSQPQMGYPGQPQMGYPGQMPGYPAPKKKKTGLIIGLSVGGGIALMLVVFFIIGVVATPFQEGTLVNGLYTNKWSKVQLAIPDDFEIADSSSYSSFEDNYTNCELYIESESAMAFIVVLTVDASTAPFSDEEDLIKAELDSSNADLGSFTVSSPSTIQAVKIAGKMYDSSYVSMSSYDSFTTLYMTLAVRKIGTHYFCLIAMSLSPENNTRFLNYFTAL